MAEVLKFTDILYGVLGPSVMIFSNDKESHSPWKAEKSPPKTNWV